MALNFAQIRQRARMDVHEHLGVPAVYKCAADESEHETTARLLRKGMVLGESGGADFITEADQVVLLECFVQQCLEGTVKRGDSLYFPDEEITVMIETTEKVDMPYRTCNVSVDD